MKKSIFNKLIVLLLIATFIFGFLVTPLEMLALSNLPFEVINKVSDPNTWARTDASQMGFIDIAGVHDGRIWTDKTVVHNGALEPDEFEVTLSALSQSFPLASGYAIPTDTVFIIDVSGSMRLIDPPNTRMRIDMLIEALNNAIDILQQAHPQNRIAVVAYGGGESGTGFARVERLLELDRYTTADGGNEFFSFNPNAQAPRWEFLQVNVGTPKMVMVNASTPTQWGIFEGARVLEQASPKTAWVPMTDAAGAFIDNVEVTRRPNIVLMTDGEPTMGWSNYLFDASAPNPVSLGPGGFPITSDQIPGAGISTFCGDGSYGEMGVSLLTILTAAHRKREVHRTYFPSGTVPGIDGQPAASTGFYSIAFGTQPSNAAIELIQATMNPGSATASPPMPNANKISADIRKDMTDLMADQYGPNGTGVFKLDPGPTATPPRNPNMGALLNSFATTPGTPILFNVSRRIAYGNYYWDTQTLSITNSQNLTLAELDFCDLYREATNLTELNNIFKEITTNIQMQGIQNVVTHGHEDSSFDGYLSFSDVLGKYMQVRNVGGIEYNNATFPRGDFASAMVNDSTQREQYIDILFRHMNYPKNPDTLLPAQLDVQRAVISQLIASNMANADFLANNSIKYYANTNRDFLGSFFQANGTPAQPPANAAAIVEVFPMWGTMDVAPAPPSTVTDLRLITFHVITALRDARFDEIFAATTAGTPMTRELSAGDQMIRWYIPADLIPIRTLTFDPTSGMSAGFTGNTVPIRTTFTVGLDRERVAAGVPWEDFGATQVPGSTDQMYFYSNRHNPNPMNVTIAFFEPHPNNPYYLGTGIDERAVIKTDNTTRTADHVSLNRLLFYNATDDFDLHWLGNNGRFTLRLDNPPQPPPSGNLIIAKQFEGLPSGMNVFEIDMSPITFLVVGYNAAGTEIYRQMIDFNSTNFRWNFSTRSFECLLSNLPLGNYRVYERGGIIPGLVTPPPPSRPNPPQIVSITEIGERVSVSFVNRYEPSPLGPPDYPAITVYKVFHGLTNAEIPTNFSIRITGPGGFDRTISMVDAVNGISFTEVAPGTYTLTEANSGRPGFILGVMIGNQPVTLPYSFTVLEDSEEITIVVDNFYRPAPPTPSPQTGISRSIAIPAVLLTLGLGAIIIADAWRRKHKNKL